MACLPAGYDWKRSYLPLRKGEVANGAYSAALTKVKEDVLKKTDGCLSGAVDADDWINDLEAQQQLCSEIQEIWVMLVLIGA